MCFHVFSLLYYYFYKKKVYYFWHLSLWHLYKMGAKISSIIKRLFDYPIKRKPICFFRQEDFSTTGEPLPKEEQDSKGLQTEYDKLVENFYTQLLEQRRQTRDMQEKNRKYGVQKVMRRFPGWNEMTIANLHSLFLLFDQNLNGMMNFEDLYASCPCSNFAFLNYLILFWFFCSVYIAVQSLKVLVMKAQWSTEKRGLITLMLIWIVG